MSSNYITTTQLRTKTSDLVELLLAGEEIDLVHRSKLIAKIQPKKIGAKTLTKKDIEELKILAREINLPRFSYKEREKRYRKHLMEKYGKSLS